MAMNESHLAEKLAKEYDAAGEALFAKSPSVLLLGATGVGKSSLINAIFGAMLAPVSNGKPCTQEFNYYPATPERTVHLYDSKGLEPFDEKFVSNLHNFIKEKTNSMKGDITQGIHCVWYVQNAATSRWSAGDSHIINTILGNIPTIVVLNKCDIASEDQRNSVTQTINSYKLPSLKGIVQVSASPQTFQPPMCPTHGDDDVNIKKAKKMWECNLCEANGTLDFTPKGLDDLLRNTALQMPEIVRMSFLASLGAHLRSKQQAAYSVVVVSTLAAYAVGWSPIPLSDAPLLVTIQLGMAASLAVIFGILKSAIMPVIGFQVAAVGSGLALSSLLKFIPAVGTIAGGIIDSSIAFVFTLAIGLLYTALFSEVYRRVGTATAEERTSVLMKILEKLEVKNIFQKIKDLLRSNSIPTSKEQLEKAMPMFGAEVQQIISREIDKVE